MVYAQHFLPNCYVPVIQSWAIVDDQQTYYQGILYVFFYYYNLTKI